MAKKKEQAIQLLKEINCPNSIMDALYIFGIFVQADEEKLNEWMSAQAVEGGYKLLT